MTQRNVFDRVVLDMPRRAFDDAVLTALERDKGVVPICGEIVRLLKIKQRKWDSVRRQDRARAQNLDKARASK